VENAATQAREIFNPTQDIGTQMFYPPFSPRWCFSFNGCVTNKGATKVLQEKIDTELTLRLQHRIKQGVFHRLSSFNGLKPQQLGINLSYEISSNILLHAGRVVCTTILHL
jgi:hypothetical protein